MTDKVQEKNNKTSIPRITQLNSKEFDREIQIILFGELLKIGKYLKPGTLDNMKPPINLLLNLVIFRYSVLSKNATFGQELLNLKYEQPFTKKHIVIYTFLNYILPYLKHKYAENTSWIQNEKFRNSIEKLEILVKISQFLNLLVFIRQGKYPSLVDRILNLTYSPVGKLNRNVGYNYITRELLWHGFIELLMYTVPLLNYKAIKRKITNVFLPISRTLKSKKNIIFNVDTKCVICDDFPTLPCQISQFCPHLACYFCIKSNVLADEKFLCPSCAEENTVTENLKFLSG